MIRPFTFAGQPARVVFGVGSIAKLPEEVQLIGAKRVLILTSRTHTGVTDRVAEDLGERFAGVCYNAAMHVPIETATETREFAEKVNAD